MINRISSSKSNIDVKHSNLQVNSPWDYELQRFLIQGGRQLLTPKRLPHCKRSIQSAGSRLLQEYKIKQSEYEQDMEQKHDTSHRVNKPADNDDGDGDGDDEVWNIEFNAKDYSSKKHSLSADVHALHRKDNMKSYNLRITLNDIIQKIEDNQGMNIDTFNYLNDDNKLNKSKEDIRSSSPLSNSTSSCHALLHSSLHAKTSPTSSSSSTPTFPSSSFNEIPNDSNDEIDISNEFKLHSMKKIRPINLFKRIIIAGLLLRATLNLIRPIQELKDAKLRSKSAQTFVELQKNIEVKLNIDHLGFDKYAYKINREKYLTYDAVKILTLPSKYRTESMIHSATVSVIATTEAFSEFPIAMQKAIIEKAWYEKRNVTICIDSNQSNWIYIIKTGQCRILKDVELKPKHLKSTVKTHRSKTEFQYYFDSSKHHEKTKGLESIAFEPFGGTTSVSLVSDGAECVAINKKFFIEHCPTNFLNWLRSKVQPFPSVEELESKLNTYREWKIYRNHVVRDSTSGTTWCDVWVILIIIIINVIGHIYIAKLI
uniref:Cyclic nucleotide-binding domain-containing protein n=1 Tax=Schistosoma haematobium TaxID=6185 RepID=A0A094ZH46_SCHHA